MSRFGEVVGKGGTNASEMGDFFQDPGQNNQELNQTPVQI